MSEERAGTKESVLDGSAATSSAWTAKHDWQFEPITLTSSPPQYRAKCRRCEQSRQGTAEAFKALDCPGRVSSHA